MAIPRRESLRKYNREFRANNNNSHYQIKNRSFCGQMIALCGFAIKNKPAQDVGGFKRCL